MRQRTERGRRAAIEVARGSSALLCVLSVFAAFVGCEAEVTRAPRDITACVDPVAILQVGTNVESGFVTCDDGFVHRAEERECVEPVPTVTCSYEEGECATDADCVERPHGACANGLIYEQACRCIYGCKTDADCGDGEICACGGVVGTSTQCVPAGCATSGDCGDGLCGVLAQYGSCGENYSRAACLDRDAQCRTDADCAAGDPIFCTDEPESPPACRVDFEHRFVCGEPFGCGVCG